MTEPSCTIALTLYEAGPYFAQNRFAYHCTSASPGWEVQPDGSIFPPSKKRIVQIDLTGLPSGNASFAGFQIAENPAKFPDKITEPYFIEEHMGVLVNPWPPPAGTTSLALEFQPPDSTAFPNGIPRSYFRLAAQVGSSPPIWDDPKVYNDPDQ